ncbi:MAG: hypothetical protein FJY07_02900 [Bacteroidetes bacterium]|nr:hypothetical protein [Bacteroidota bacterium]
MKLFYSIFLYLFSITIFLSGCGPKSITTIQENLNPESLDWIPFTGDEDISFIYDTNEMAYSSQAKQIYYDYLRYKTDQGGFFEGQKDYYADFERQSISFESESTPYFISYYLERNKGDLGDWDVFKVAVGDGDYYKNELKIITYESDSYDKGEDYDYKSELTLNGVTFDSVYFKKQDRRPFELYYTKKLGVIAFKVSSTEIWMIKQDSISGKL